MSSHDRMIQFPGPIKSKKEKGKRKTRSEATQDPQAVGAAKNKRNERTQKQA